MAHSREIIRHALTRLRDRTGGTIKGNKLYPLDSYLAQFVPKEPDASLSRQTYILQTAPQKERKVLDRMRALGLDGWCPVVKRRVRAHGNRHREIHSPMITGYVFPIFDEIRDHWQHIYEIDGAVRLFTLLERPVPIMPEIVERLQRKEIEESGRVRSRRQPIGFKINDLVRIIEPISFAGLFGLVTAIDDVRRHLRVEIDIFGRKVPTWLAVENVEAV